ncbi:MAG: hypothetical protein HKN33_12255 [Pyrinomonadaceae bacterium]|nr:hypothetical protein [Pyrinomonadaceae bacterium]
MITVERTTFRWSAYFDWGDLFFVAELAESPGCKLEVNLTAVDRSDLDDREEVRPWEPAIFDEKLVAGLISAGLMNAWNPIAKGEHKAFDQGDFEH